MVITSYMFSISIFITRNCFYFTFLFAVLKMGQRFTVDGENNRQYRRFNAAGTRRSVRLLPPSPYSNPVTHFLDSVSDLFEYALRKCNEPDMVGITISNEVNVQDKPIGISFRQKDKLSEEVIWSMFEKFTQSSTRFNAMDRFVVIHSVRMPVGFGRAALRTKGWRIWFT